MEPNKKTPPDINVDLTALVQKAIGTAVDAMIVLAQDCYRAGETHEQFVKRLKTTGENYKKFMSSL